MELADIEIKKLLRRLSIILKRLEVEHHYLLDFDITQDFAGIF